MREPGNKKPARSKKSVNNQTELNKHKQLIIAMERLLLTTEQRDFNDRSIDGCIKQINRVIIWIDDNLNPVECNKDKIRKSLSDARIELILAFEEYQNKGKNRKYYRCLATGHNHLKKALTYW